MNWNDLDTGHLVAGLTIIFLGLFLLFGTVGTVLWIGKQLLKRIVQCFSKRK